MILMTHMKCVYEFERFTIDKIVKNDVISWSNLEIESNLDSHKDCNMIILLEHKFIRNSKWQKWHILNEDWNQHCYNKSKM